MTTKLTQGHIVFDASLLNSETDNGEMTFDELVERTLETSIHIETEWYEMDNQEVLLVKEVVDPEEQQ